MQIRKAVIATALVWLVALMTHTGAQAAHPPPAAPAGAPQAPGACAVRRPAAARPGQGEAADVRRSRRSSARSPMPR